MITWSEAALQRSGLSLSDADNLVSLSSTDGYATKDEARRAWEEHEPSTHTIPGSPLIHLVFPAGVYIERYARQAKALGY